jgi:hypothetical protein
MLIPSLPTYVLGAITSIGGKSFTVKPEIETVPGLNTVETVNVTPETSYLPAHSKLTFSSLKPHWQVLCAGQQVGGVFTAKVVVVISPVA